MGARRSLGQVRCLNLPHENLMPRFCRDQKKIRRTLHLADKTAVLALPTY